MLFDFCRPVAAEDAVFARIACPYPFVELGGGLGKARAAAWSQEWLAERWQGRLGLQAAPTLLCEMEEAERKRGRHFPATTLAPGRAPCGLGLG